MKKIILYSGLIILAACGKKMEQNSISVLPYPDTKKAEQTDDYHGIKVSDPYRWLEYDTAADVAEWVKAENNVTENYLGQIPFRDKIRSRLTEIWNFPKYTAPFKEGEYLFYFKNDGLQNQSVLYYQKGEGGKAEVFLDPNTLSKDGTVSLASYTFSKDHKYCAVGIASSGSDWNEIFVMNVATKEKLSDKIEWVKFSGATWYKNGFYYSRYDAPVAGKEFSNQNEHMKIFYHEMGTDQSKDMLVYQDPQHPLRYFNAAISEDERYLFVYVSEGTSGTEILYQDLAVPGKKSFTTLFKGFANNYSVVNNTENKILVLTDYNAPKYRLVEVDPAKPDPAAWKVVIPESADLLESVSTGGNKLFATYLKDASSKVYQYDLSGKQEHVIALPGIGTAGGFGALKTEQDFYYSYTSFTEPGAIYHYDIATGESKLFMKSEVRFNPADFEEKQVFYTSKDGTKVPMFIVHKKGVKLDGNNPTLLYGYGGFNISLTPSFSISRMMFLEKGGVYAIANLRGGGEYGEDWHKAGMLDKKQNVFDDFIAAAEFLISEKYTSSSKLAIHGGSNGGLLVGACMTQRPELFKVAVPVVGVLDMMRYHKFTIGWGWSVEYGNSDNSKDVPYLMKYSPLHNVKEGVNYPATLVMTADHDDRVVPAHSFKFAAELQAKQQTNGNPVLIRVDTKSGHGAGKPTTKLIEDAADMWSFVLWNLGAEL